MMRRRHRSRLMKKKNWILGAILFALAIAMYALSIANIS
jgi:hypothetical protein